MWNENRLEQGPNRTTESEIDPTNASQERRRTIGTSTKKS